MSNKISGISIQVSLSGYSFKIYDSGSLVSSSEWMPAGSLFTTAELQKRYDRVDISLFTHKCALVPRQFFSPEKARELLSETCILSDEDEINYIEVPQFASVMIFSPTTGETLSKAISNTVLRTDGKTSPLLPELYWLLQDFNEISDYNKVLASFADGRLFLAVGQGKSLLLCNSYEAADFTTGLYYIFMVLKRMQLNPEMTSIHFRTPLSEEDLFTLYRYFKSVETD